ncbi:MAG: DUF1295 domain-containing protein [Microscillaceae bacterium]|jgi:protein-S-isoprenylcysteine O-methyltransferase Ste14|nr:DUF1295 domain-containing protein [Microscillaceae bacterium]
MLDWQLGIAWLGFYATHSLLATDTLKNQVTKHFPTIFKYYRLIYNLIAGITFLPLMIWQFFLQPPLWFPAMFGISWFLQGLGALILILALRNYDLSAFAGTDAWRTHPPKLEPLQMSGLNAWVRHPLYLGVVIILIGFFLGKPHAASFTFGTVTFIYLVIGIYLEEKKLLKLYGTAYRQYQQKVKCLIPGIW